MKNLKKILAVVLAMVLMAAMSVTMFAADPADMNGEGGVIGEFTAPTQSASAKPTSLKIYKEITAYNPTACTVNAPTMSYTYAITAGSSGKDVIDAAGVHAQTKAGIISGVTLSNDGAIAWTPAETLSAGPDGVKNVKDITIDFSDVEFAGAGVYRYVITETANAYVESGVVDGSSSAVRYLDVYVKDAATAGSYEIYGYVLFSNDNSIVGDNTATNENNVAAAQKTEGFVDVDTTSATSADSYYTFNFSVSKTLTNDNANKTHQFPFTITLANGTVTRNVLPIMTIDGNATQTALTAAPIAGTWSPTIADSASVTYVGIPTGTTVTIKENNDVVGTTYKVTISGADTNPAAANVYSGNDSGNAVITSGATAGAAATANKDVSFNNNFELISPTGVILRIAPFAIILLAGIVLFVVARRRRVED